MNRRALLMGSAAMLCLPALPAAATFQPRWTDELLFGDGTVTPERLEGFVCLEYDVELVDWDEWEDLNA